jgi:hypothetical protein
MLFQLKWRSSEAKQQMAGEKGESTSSNAKNDLMQGGDEMHMT